MMEDHVKKYTQWIQAAIASAFGLAGAWLLSFLQSLQLDYRVAAAGVFAAAYFLIRWTGAAVAFVVNNSPWLRRWILRNRHIEGYWIDIIFNPTTKSVREFSFITISFAGGKLTIEGIVHDGSIRQIGHFNGRFSSYLGHKFEYAYNRHSAFDQRGYGSGLGQYDFAPERPFPMSATGRYYEPALDQDLSLTSKRITEKEDLDAIEDAVKNSPQALAAVRQRLIRKYAQQFQCQFAEYNVLQPIEDPLLGGVAP